MKDVSKKLVELFDLYPIDLTIQHAASRDALAKLYMDADLRAYFEYCVKKANRDLIQAKTIEQMLYYKSRMDTLVQLLALSKEIYVNGINKQPKK